jgi:hypothetical protein
MNYQHKELAGGRWNQLSFLEQMANIGSEVERTIGWRNKDNLDYSRRAFDRALELIDLTISDEKNLKRLKEICRVREALADHFLFDNIYQSTDADWSGYFYPFNYASRRTRA